MKIVAIYNIKGGVGKTATSVNMAYLASQEGRHVLIWDLDPQGASSFYFRTRPRVKGGVDKLLHVKKHFGDNIKSTDYENLDILPADFSYRHMDLELEDTSKPTRRLRKLLKTQRDDYDLVILDCPPSISLVSENVFTSADALLIPTIPTTLSLRTLEQIYRYFDKHGLQDGRLFPFFSMVDRRKSLHRLILDNPPKKFKGFLHSAIPYSSEVERMGITRQPLPLYCHRGPAYEAYVNLWDEIKTLLQL
jgi:cellulose biosynthesis protein BcsQ